MPRTVAQLKALIDQIIKTNGNEEITGAKDNALRKELCDSFLNLKDGGLVVEKEAGYSSDIELIDDKAFTHKKYVDDEVNDINDNLESHESNTSNPHNVTKAQIGLGNADNTSDPNKPVSIATAAALLGKQDKAYKIVSPSSITAFSDLHYEVLANSDFTDIASPVAGSYYKIKCAGGIVTINATSEVFSSQGTIIERYYNGSAWTTNVYKISNELESLATAMAIVL